MPATIANLGRFLEAFAPPHLAEEWDNVGLLVGDPAGPVGSPTSSPTLSHSSARCGGAKASRKRQRSAIVAAIAVTPR